MGGVREMEGMGKLCDSNVISNKKKEFMCL